jgi:hypothetical protein
VYTVFYDYFDAAARVGTAQSHRDHTSVAVSIETTIDHAKPWREALSHLLAYTGQ